MAVLSLIVFTGSTVHANQPTHPLIRQLGDPRFERRVAAEREILQQGPAALEWIEAGLHSNDGEIRQRSLRLSEILRKSSLAAQRERIRANPWILPPELAPGWEFFQSLAGDGPAARDIYVRMIEQEGELMLALALRPGQWTEDFDRRCADLRMSFLDRRGGVNELNPMTILTLLFLAEHPENKPSLLSAQTIVTLLVDTYFYTHVQRAPEGEAKVFQALISEWVLRSGHVTPQNRLELATRYQLPAGASAAREIIASRHAGRASRSQLQNAIRFITVYSPQTALRDLEPLLNLSEFQLISLKDASKELLREKPAPETATAWDLQASDLALLGILQTTGQSPLFYGFADIRIDLDHRYNTNVPLMTSDQDRHRALVRWLKWRAAHSAWFRDPPRDAREGEAG